MYAKLVMQFFFTETMPSFNKKTGPMVGAIDVGTRTVRFVVRFYFLPREKIFIFISLTSLINQVSQ